MTALSSSWNQVPKCSQGFGHSSFEGKTHAQVHCAPFQQGQLTALSNLVHKSRRSDHGKCWYEATAQLGGVSCEQLTRPTWAQTLKGLFSQEQGYYLINRMHPSSYPSCTHRTARSCWARLEWWDCPGEPPGFWFALGWCLPLNTFSFVAHVTTSAAKGFPNQHPNKTRTK